MIRFALLFLVALSAFTFACGGDDDSDSATPTGQNSDAPGSGTASETPVAEAWDGELAGPISGAFENTLTPQCGETDDFMSVTIQGIVNGDSVVVSILSAGPGTFDMMHPADEGPTIDVSTAGDSPAEWYAAAGGDGTGELTLEDDGSGTANVTLPTIVTGTQEDITLTAGWTCPAQ